MNDIRADYDSPWKEIIERYFPEFMAFFFPRADSEIDWRRDYAFLDKELQQVVREAEIGPRRVDKLAKVTRLADGAEAWVLVHIEVQGQPEEDFPERMYTYNYRLFDRYRRRIASLAVLADANRSWRPHRFAYELFGCRVSLDFPAVKLLDYDVDWEALEADPNPFAIVTMAHLQTQATRHRPAERYAAKLNLAKMLYKRGYHRQDILELFRFIDWVMALSPELEEQFMTDVVAYEAQERKPYVTSVERIAIRRGIEQGIEQGMQQAVYDLLLETLETRFGPVPEPLKTRLGTITDIGRLKALHHEALLAGSLDDFEERLDK
jgi:hypothetical protein